MSFENIGSSKVDKAIQSTASDSSDSLARAGWRACVVGLMAGILSSVLLLGFLYVEAPSARIALAVASGVVLLTSIGLTLWCRRAETNWSALTVLPLCASAWVLLLLLWNHVYLKYCDAIPLPMRKEAFRTKLYRWYTPIYGRPDELHGGPLWLLIGCGLLVLMLLAILATRRVAVKWTLGIILACQAISIIAVGFSDGRERMLGNEGGYELFGRDLKKFDGGSDIIHNYVSKMSKLSWFGRHYPPGNLLLMQWAQDIGMPVLTKLLVILSTFAATLCVWKHAKLLSNDEETAKLAAILFSLSFGVVIFCTLNTTSLLLAPTSIAAIALMCDIAHPHPRWRIVLAASLVVYTWLSFSFALLIVCLGLILLQNVRRGFISLRQMTIILAQSAGWFTLAYVILWLCTGYNAADCFVQAIINHHRQQNGSGFDTPARYLLRSTGNILAYGFTCMPLIAATIHAVVIQRKSARSFTFAAPLLLSILLAGFSGLFFFETERIWMFFTPLLAVSAAMGVRSSSRTNYVLLSAIVGSSAVMLFGAEAIFTYWRP